MALEEVVAAGGIKKAVVVKAGTVKNVELEVKAEEDKDAAAD